MRILKQIIRHRTRIMSLFLVSTSIFALALGLRLSSEENIIDNSVSVWFLQDDPELAAYDEYNREFGEQEWTIGLIETQSIQDLVFLRELKDLSDEIDDLKHVKRVLSLAHVDKQLRNHPAIDGLLSREEDDRNTALLIQNDNLIRNQTPYRIQLVDSIKAIVKKYETVTRFSLAGTTVLNADLNKTSQRDVLVFYVMISVMMVFFGLSSLRSIRDLLVMLSVVIGTIIPVMGLIALLKIPFNMITVMLPTVLIALAVADVIHVINGFHGVAPSRDRHYAITNTIRNIWKPGLLTSLTTVVGFVSLTPSSVLPIRQLGIFASIGIILAWLITMTVVPGLLLRFWPQRGPTHKQPHRRANLSTKIAPFAANHKNSFTAIGLLLLVPLIGLQQLEVDTNYSKFFGSKTELTQAYAHIEERAFPQSLVNVVIRFPDQPYLTQKDSESIAAFGQSIEGLPNVTKVLSMNELLATIGPNSKQVKPSTRFLSAEHDLRGPSRPLMNGGRTHSETATEPAVKTAHLQILTNAMSSDQLYALKASVYAIGEKIFGAETGLWLTGTTALWANMDSHVSQTQLVSLLGIGLFLLLLLPWVLASFRLGVLAFLFSFMPLAITLGLMGLLQIKINIATALIGGICMGIVVDDTIHLLTRLQIELKNGLDLHSAVDHAVASVGRSIIMTSVILVGAFISMATSDFLPTAHFGIFMSISIILGLFLDLFILPNVLKQVL